MSATATMRMGSLVSPAKPASSAKPSGPSTPNGSTDTPVVLPTLEQVNAELARSQDQRHRHNLHRNVAFAMAGVFAAAVLLSLYVFPMFRIYGESMTPTLNEGDVVVATKPGGYQTGDLVAFSFNNKLLTKRVIAGPGDWVDIDGDGNVSVNGQQLDESYLPEGAKSLGQCDINLPYQVPENKYFVMGDRRSVSVDSRLQQVGCIPADQIVGKLELRIWPLTSIGPVQ
ncbi:MAG: signal peptidase I [Atopobiaceae bacterium]